MFEWICRPTEHGRQKQGTLRARHRAIDELMNQRLCETDQLPRKIPRRAYWLRVVYELIDGSFPSITHLMISLRLKPYHWICIFREDMHEGAMSQADSSRDIFLESNSPALSALEEFIFRFEQQAACWRISRRGPRAIPHPMQVREEDVPEFLAASRHEESDLA